MGEGSPDLSGDDGAGPIDGLARADAADASSAPDADVPPEAGRADADAAEARDTAASDADVSDAAGAGDVDAGDGDTAPADAEVPDTTGPDDADAAGEAADAADAPSGDAAVPEESCNGIDDDGDGDTDEDFHVGGGEPWQAPSDPDVKKWLGQPCGTGACEGGTVICGGDGAATCSTLDEAADDDGCNELDDDCDGDTDEDCEPCGELGAECPGGATCSEAGWCTSDEGERIAVPAGRFWMGCNDAVSDCSHAPRSLPAHPVEVPAFAIGRTQVTQADYQGCVDAGACTELGGENCPSGEVSDPASDSAQYANPDATELPAVCATWTQARSYCDWNGGRLCTEAEWELAARGSCAVHCPDGGDDCCKQLMPAWPMDGVAGGGPDCNAYPQPKPWGLCLDALTPVRAFPAEASPYGMLNAAGHGLEWVRDCWHNSYSGAPSDGSAWLDGGGSCLSGTRTLRSSRPLAQNKAVGHERRPGDLNFDFKGIRCCYPVEEP